MKDTPKIIILGAGPCGLGAAWRLSELGYEDYTVFEQNGYPGGLAASFLDSNGFTWDIGGHVLHSHYTYFDRVFESIMEGMYETHQRESWIRMLNIWIPYPFQNNIHRLPLKIRNECLKGLLEISKSKNLKKIAIYKPHISMTFAEWILQSFGKGLAKNFFFPYNKKVWAYSPKRMSAVWVGDRISSVDINRILENIRLHHDDISWGPNHVFQFPRFGGTGDIWNRVARKFIDHILYNKKVTLIDSRSKVIYFSDKTKESYDVLFTTIPITDLYNSVTGCHLKYPDALHYSSVHIVGIGLRGMTPEYLKTKCWIYFPEKEVPFFRATVFSNYSKNNTPDGCWSLMTEISSSSFCPKPNGDIVKNVINGATLAGLITKFDSIIDTWIYENKFGYPTPTIGRDEYLLSIIPKLEEHSIFSRGRFGFWKYEVGNQDHTFMQGVEWVDRILNNKKEVTINNPKIVNNQKK
jgi:protoporphyrinogen oxidase